jgi:hypothetical protein
MWPATSATLGPERAHRESSPYGDTAFDPPGGRSTRRTTVRWRIQGSASTMEARSGATGTNPRTRASIARAPSNVVRPPPGCDSRRITCKEPCQASSRSVSASRLGTRANRSPTHDDRPGRRPCRLRGALSLATSMLAARLQPVPSSGFTTRRPSNARTEPAPHGPAVNPDDRKHSRALSIACARRGPLAGEGDVAG